MPTCTMSTSRPPRKIGMVRSRRGSRGGTSTVSNVRSPRPALARAVGDSDRLFARGRSARGWPSGSRKRKSSSENSSPSRLRRMLATSLSLVSWAVALVSRTTWATVSSEASRSCMRLQRRTEYETAPTTRRMARRIPLYQRVSRVRIDSGRSTSALGGHAVAGAPHGVDQPALALPVDLAPEIAHADVDDVALRIEVEAPHVLGDHRAGEDAADVPEKVVEQGVLAGGEADAPAAPGDLPGGGVEREIGEAERGSGLDGAAAEQRADAGQELLE